ncbi:MAG: penicillin-binding protein 2 [Dehalococcoidia bacterium]|nr:penicillin-binding protein 2 [Dehalococcoidia bacterium]
MLRDLKVERWRLVVVILVLAGSAVGLILRVGYLQTAEYASFARLAAAEHWGQQEITPQRGTIRDRNGYVLAATVTVFDVFVDPGVPQDPDKGAMTASLIAPVVKLPIDQVKAALLAKGERPALLVGDVSYEAGSKIEEMQLAGIRLKKVTKRVYPEGNLAAPLVGFVGQDQRGLTGLEADFNRELMGKVGMLTYERDTVGEEIPLGYREETPSQDGADIVLTIDRFVQRLVETELDKAMKKHNSSGATVIVMEVKTGAILAMANRPSFDLTKLNLADNAKVNLFRIASITDMYEPGSIFKVFTVASALQEKLIQPGTTFNCTGVVTKNGWPIRNYNGSAHGVETMTDILKNSCNIGTVWVSDLLGADRFYKYIKNFGFGQRTYVELEGEASGLLRTNQSQGWTAIDLAANAFGQGISVTPLQLVTAFAALGNGGRLMRPYVVRQVAANTGTRDFQPVMVRQVISEETSRTLTKMMNVSGEAGTGNLAAIPGYRIAGKSGTAQISLKGGYTGDTTVAGFAGFAPMEDPRVVILVRVDEPKDIPWGSSVAAPLFKSVMEQTLLYLRVPPTDPSKVGKPAW